MEQREAEEEEEEEEEEGDPFPTWLRAERWWHWWRPRRGTGE